MIRSSNRGYLALVIVSIAYSVFGRSEARDSAHRVIEDLTNLTARLKTAAPESAAEKKSEYYFIRVLIRATLIFYKQINNIFLN